jgi:mannose-1-phosphate guanylyltransferase
MAMPDGETLLSKSFARAAHLSDDGDIILVTNRELYFQSQDLFIQPGFHGNLHAILEPVGRNTAPAITMAALLAQELDPDAILLILPADHLVSPLEVLADMVGRATELARRGHIVTFGVPARTPETGFGYIEIDRMRAILGGYAVRSFKEKPDFQTAQRFVIDGQHLWNSGMFCFSAATLLLEMEAKAPDLMASALDAWKASRQWRDQKDKGTRRFELDAEKFTRLPDLSIDFAIIEKSDRIAVVTGDLSWSDVGSWGAISALTAPDACGNRVIGQAILQDTRNTFVQSEDRLIATIGIDDLVIIDTADALLVAANDKSQDVKAITEHLRSTDHDAYKLHKTVRRPWGTYTVLTEFDNYKVKQITVRPGASLSLQLHHHRSEHWVVIAGTAWATVEHVQHILNPGQSTYIPVGSKHRLENRGEIPLAIIEVQTGDYLGEDDIVRFADTDSHMSAIGS